MTNSLVTQSDLRLAPKNLSSNSWDVGLVTDILLRKTTDLIDLVPLISLFHFTTLPPTYKLTLCIIIVGYTSWELFPASFLFSSFDTGVGRSPNCIHHQQQIQSD
jgi:hypothetical protein